MLNQRYSTVSMTLHWLMFFLLIAVYACIELRELYPKGSDPREALKTWHFMLGLSVFWLVWVRIIAKLMTKTPSSVPSINNWQHKVAKFVHFYLYIFMIGMPIAGWLILSGEGKDIPYFGLNLPALIQENESLAKTIEEIHETSGKIGYFVIALHTSAALFHHYILKNETLVRMLPKFLTKSRKITEKNDCSD